MMTGLTTLLIPAVDAARESQNRPIAFPWLAPFYCDHPLLFVLLATLASVALTVALLATLRSCSIHLARRIVWTKPRREPEISAKAQAKIAAVFVALIFGSVLLCCSGVIFYSQPEEISKLQLSRSLTAKIFAECPFHYEPPGYLSIEVLDDGKVVVPRYRFVGIGPERVPETPFTVITSEDGSVAALIQDDDIQFMIDLASRECWPPPNWNVVQFAPDLADRLFASLASHHELTFSRLEGLKRYAALQKSRNKPMHAEPPVARSPTEDDPRRPGDR